MSDKHKRTLKALDKLYNVTNSIADNNVGRNRGLVAGTAASIFEMSIEKIKAEGEQLDEQELNQLRQIAEGIDDEDFSDGKKNNHFIDSMLERLMKHTIPVDEQELLEQKLKDPERSKKPGLSIRILASNFKKLSSKMSLFFEIQYGVIHVITWKTPTKTLSFLVLYTAICMWPHLVLALPLLFLLFGVMIPAYIYRHPMRTPDLIKVKRRGQSLLDFFNESQENSIIMDYLGDKMNEDRLLLESSSLRLSVSSMASSAAFTQQPISASAVASDPADINERISKRKRAKYAKSQVSLMINMRDLQNLLSDVLAGIDTAEKVWYDTAGFKDERLSTFLFYIVMFASSVVLFLGRFIPWRLIFIQSGWAGLLLCHPHSKKLITTIKQNQKRNQGPKKDKKEEKENDKKEPAPKGKFDRRDIIVDDSPEIRMVEVYELQTKSLTKNEWSFYKYTSRMFDTKDHLRISGKRPDGVDHLSKVLPPPDWKFDMGFENKWTIDTKPADFLKYRAVDAAHLKMDDDEGWIYDTSNVDSDSVYSFRRRRLVRECYRYSRPPKQPVKE